MKSLSRSHHFFRHCEERSDEAIQTPRVSTVASAKAHLRRKRTIPRPRRFNWIASSAIGLLAMTMLAACEPDASPRAKEAKDWIDKFYTRYTIRGYWGFFGAEAKDKNVNVELNVPEQQAQDLMKKFGEYERKQFIARNACPPRTEEVWSMLDPEGDIIIHARLNGNPFAEVSCKNTM